VAVYRRGVVETLPIDGRTTMPSVVSFRDDGMLVGMVAKSQMLIHPERTVASAKRSMGDRGKVYHINRKPLTPVNISSIVLKRLVKAAREGLGEDVFDAVIGVPAYFNEAQKEDTKRAGEEAGLDVLRLVPEPTAAAIAYALGKGKDQKIMVYDLGGGTFDVSILFVKGNNFEVKAVGGDSRLGGDDFDLTIMNWVAARFKKETGLDVMGDPTREGQVARQRLKEAAEHAKIELSESDHAVIILPSCLGRALEVEISLAEYNALIAPMLQRTVDCMRSTLADAKLRASDIDRVILVGGSTKNRAVREIIAREIKEPYVAERVDEVVAHGAAIVAASLFAPEIDALPIEVTNVTGHSLGVDVLDEAGKIIFHPIIPRQTVYPCRRGLLGMTVRPMQEEVIMRVFRGEAPDPQRNDYLGELSLPLSPPSADLVPIAAVFELDADGLIRFTAVHLSAGLDISTICQWAGEENSELNLDALDLLIKNGKARTKVATIKSR
jgi:molecular chaperone DnaK (HSP70)